MEEVFVPLGFFATVVIIIYLYVRRKERLALIEKGADASIFVFEKKVNGTLKWGLLLVGAGIGILIANALYKNHVMDEEAAYFSMVFLFGGIALVISHFISKKHTQNKE